MNVFKNHIKFNQLKSIFVALMFVFISGCGLKVSSTGDHLSTVISGLVPSLLGSQSIYSSKLNTNATCSHEAKLFKITESGTIDENSPLATSVIDDSARYTFVIKNLNLDQENSKIEYLVKVYLCSGETLKRPVTDFNEKQDVDAKSTVISEVINADSLITKKLNESNKSEINELMNSLTGSTTQQALNSLINNSTLTNQFTEIFGSNPSALFNAKPEINFNKMPLIINEESNSSYEVSAYHIDPNYSFAYRWKLNGVVKSSNSTWNFMPSANQSGSYTIDVYVGKDNGSGDIDLSKPYFTKSYNLVVHNSILPMAPNFILNSSTPSPRTTNTVQVDLATGAGLSNCGSFSNLAITDSATVPGVMQFNISCTVSGTQIQSVTFDNTDGAKTLYLWAMDHVGVISSPRTVNLVLDQTAPVVGLAFSETLVKGADSKIVTFNVSDATTGLNNVTLLFSIDGVDYSLVDSLDFAQNNYSWSVPSVTASAASLKLRATDLAGNSSEVISSSFGIDSTSPSAPTLTRVSNAISNSSTISMSIGSCSDTTHIKITESNTAPNAGDSGWQPCTTVVGGITANISGEGSHTLYAWAKDAVGNVASSANSVSVNLDQTNPVINIATVPSTRGNGNYGSVSWTLTETNVAAATNFTLEIFNGSSWSIVGTVAANTGVNTNQTYNLNNFTVPQLDISNAKLRISLIDAAGNVTTAASNDFIVDSTGPSLTQLSIVGNVASTGNKNILINFSGNDQLSNILFYCLKLNIDSNPTLNDSCWSSTDGLSQADLKNINVSNFPYQLGSIQGDYQIKIWFKDELNNISMMSSTLNIDKTLISFYPDPVPIISNLTSSSTDFPSSPLTESDTTALISSDLYIKWKISDNVSIPAGAISLYYTTDEVSYTLVSSALNNSINNSCTINSELTGCFKWTAASPVSSYYRIKLVVSDTSNQTVFDLSNPLNTGKVKFLSGNTSLGIGGIATNSIILSENENYYNDYLDMQSFVVTKTGYIFIKYANRGLVYISPLDGLIKDVAPNTGTSSGDGGSVFNATFRSVRRLTLDKDDNLIIADYNQLRKVNLQSVNWEIQRIAGGGASALDGANALDAQLPVFEGGLMYHPTTITSLPNGNIFFEKGKDLWFYEESTNKVKKYLTLTGMGTDNMTGWYATFNNTNCPGQNINIEYNKTNSMITKIIRRMSATTAPECGSQSSTRPYYNTNFNVETGVATSPHPPQTTWSSLKMTGLDGKIYLLNHARSSLLKYNSATNQFDRLLGNNKNGRCVDGTSAIDCPVVIMSAFINEYGKIYFLDLGVLRTVDDQGKVQTIAGQPRNFGIGYNPISARISQIDGFDLSGDNVYIKNELENQIVKFSLTGGNLEHIAGNTIKGSILNNYNAQSSSLPECGWSYPCLFKIDVVNNRLYHHTGAGGSVGYIDLSTGLWSIQKPAGSVQDGAARITYLGISPNGLIAQAASHYGVSGNKTTFQQIDSLGVSTRVYGTEDLITSSPPYDLCDGVLGTTCILPGTLSNAEITQLQWSADLNTWLIARRNKKMISKLPNMGGTVNHFESVNNSLTAFVYVEKESQKLIYYCDMSGNLYKRNTESDVETQLVLPVGSMKCSSENIYFHTGRNSLIFAYKQNGLYGIAEYVDP